MSPWQARVLQQLQGHESRARLRLRLDDALDLDGRASGAAL